jgi:hypothetical protein
LLAQSVASVNSESHFYSLNNDVEGTTGIADTVRSTKTDVYWGEDSTFVKGQSPSTGVARCTTINKQVGGIMVSIIYTFNKKGRTSLPVVGSIRLTSCRVPSGADPITILSSASEIRGPEIAFTIGAVDIISWDGNPWGAPTKIDGTYDTSSGKYSVQIHQMTPVTR